MYELGGGGARPVAIAALLAAFLPVAADARADDAGTDAVYLKNGGIVRGTIMEYDPSTDARMRLADGSVRTIAADLIARVAMGGPPTAPAPAATPPTARLHVDGPEEVEVVGRSGEDYEWSPVCDRSCDQPVRLDWEYRIRGAGLRASPPFHLSASAGQPVRIAVEPASEGAFTLGIVGMIAGGVAGYIGAVVWLLGSIGAGEETTASGSTQGTPNESVATTGGIIALVGGAVLLAGTVATYQNRSTRIRQTSHVDAGASLRVPEWRSAARRPELPLPPPNVAPIVTFAF